MTDVAVAPTPVTSVRDTLHRLLDGHRVAVYRWFPHNVGEIPCYVVNRPTWGPTAYADMDSFIDVTVPVQVLGRRDSSVEAQRELDTLADEAWALLWTPPRVDQILIRASTCRPTTVQIGELQFPAYEITVVCTTRPFC